MTNRTKSKFQSLPLKTDCDQGGSVITSKRKCGRKTTYGPEVWQAIMESVANGASLAAALREHGPSYSLAKKVINSDPEIRQAYSVAINSRADHLADEIVRIADEEPPEGLDGRGLSAWVQRQRLRVHARQWTSSKLAPARWGDRLEFTVETKPSISVALALADARLRQAQLAYDNDITDIEVSPPRVISHQSSVPMDLEHTDKLSQT